MNLKEAFEKNRVTFQLVYGVVLLILIPVFIAYNTVFIVNTYNKSIDTLVQRDGLAMGRAIYALIKEKLYDTVGIQASIESLIKGNSQIIEISVLEPFESGFRVAASSRADEIGNVFSYGYYTLAWAQPDNDGLATDFWRFAENNGTSVDDVSSDERFWLVAMPMLDGNGTKSALLTIKLSSAIIDTLTAENRNQSIYLLIITIIVVVLFLMIAVRLWDYALLYKKIRELDEMKDAFIGMASHELRTPVTAIRGYVSLILEGDLGAVNEEVKNTLKSVDNSARRLGVLVNDLLVVNQIEQGRMTIEIKPTDIGALLKKTMDDLTLSAKDKGLILLFKPHQVTLPEVNVDPDKCTQVLFNVIGNAIKYTEHGQVEVMTAETSGGRYLEIKVKDTGIGMSADDRKNLFSKFYRVHNEKTRNIEGTGLGLWITKELVELMNGKISVDSIEDVGTQVTLTFPVYLHTRAPRV